METQTKEKLQDIHNFMSEQSDKMERLLAQIVSKRKKEERQTLSYMDDMCAESLDPETSEKWESVKSILSKTRKL